MNWNDLLGVTSSKTELPDLAERLRALATSLDDAARLGPGKIHTRVTISEWTVAKRTVPILVGKMDGHPSIKDGRIGATTEIFYVDLRTGVARTFNRWYKLGPSMLSDNWRQ